jgi:hypothetical protein
MADAHEGYMIYPHGHGHVLCINMFVFDLDPNHKPIRKFIAVCIINFGGLVSVFITDPVVRLTLLFYDYDLCGWTPL